MNPQTHEIVFPEQAPVGFSLSVALQTDPLYNVSPIVQDIYLMPYDHILISSP